MQRFKSILLLAGDPGGREGLLARAADLAIRNGARLTVVEVLEAVPSSRELDRRLGTRSVERVLDRDLADELDQLVAPRRDQIPELETKVLHGKASMEVIREVLREGHDLVMLAAEGQKEGIWFGTTATHLLRKCPCAVWITRPQPRPRYARILAAVDPVPAEPSKLELSQRILTLAASLARFDRAGSLHVVHAWKAFGEAMLRRRARLSEREVRGYVTKTREEHERALKELMAKIDLAGLETQVHFVNGEPGHVITRLANRKKADIIVMGTVSRGGVPGLLLGNTAEEVLYQVHCALLAVKPQGFVTPVKPA